MSNRSAGKVSDGNSGSVHRGSRGKITVFRYNKGMRDNRVVGGSGKYDNSTVDGDLTLIRKAKFNDRSA